jgi:5-methylcytosine-specific restriction protein B
VYIWKLRNELSEALDRVDLSRIKLYAASSENRTTINYWWLNTNPKVWSFSDLSTGSIQYFTFYNERGNRRRVFQNFVDAKPGDLVVGYEANPTKKIVALGTIAENDGERLGFEKTEALLNPISYSDLKGFEELKDMEFFANPNGTLFKLTKAEYEFILDLIREENPEKTEQATSYTEENFLNEVYMSREDLETLLSLLRNKKNLILEGPPGVGKTFAAKRLAYAYMKQEKDENIELVQFHQNYSYEDFVMGYKPKEDGFELEYGIFYRFCQKASNKPDEPFFYH